MTLRRNDGCFIAKYHIFQHQTLSELHRDLKPAERMDTPRAVSQFRCARYGSGGQRISFSIPFPAARKQWLSQWENEETNCSFHGLEWIVLGSNRFHGENDGKFRGCFVDVRLFINNHADNMCIYVPWSKVGFDPPMI